MKYRLRGASDVELGKDGSKWEHDYVPLNAAAVALKAHKSPSKSGAATPGAVQIAPGRNSGVHPDNLIRGKFRRFVPAKTTNNRVNNPHVAHHVFDHKTGAVARKDDGSLAYFAKPSEAKAFAADRNSKGNNVLKPGDSVEVKTLAGDHHSFGTLHGFSPDRKQVHVTPAGREGSVSFNQVFDASAVRPKLDTKSDPTLTSAQGAQKQRDLLEQALKERQARDAAKVTANGVTGSVGNMTDVSALRAAHAKRTKVYTRQSKKSAPYPRVG